MFLITGCSGFIGYHITKNFLETGHKVIGIDNLNSYYSLDLKKARLRELKKFDLFNFHKLDLSKISQLKKLNTELKKVRYVIHLAGQAGVRYSIVNPYSYIDDNIKAHLNLLEIFKGKKIDLFIYASSSSIYGNNKNNLNPESFYAVTKKTIEDMSYVYHRIYKINFIGLRFFTVYGSWGRPDMFVYKFIEKSLQNKVIDIYNFGNHKRSFTHIDDVIFNFNLLFKKYSKYSKKIFKIYNIGNPKSVKLKNLITEIEKIINIKTKKRVMAIQKGEVKSTKANITKEIKSFNSKYQINTAQGIKEFYEWFKLYKKI